jgi:hypothetical protein
LNLVKEQETVVVPEFTYKSNVKFELLEDFEDVGIDLYTDALSDTSIVNITDAQFPGIVKYGNNCGAIYLDQFDSLFKAATSSDLDLPKNEDVFLEIDYMNSNSMVMGVIAENSTQVAEHTPLVGFLPQDASTMVWKKMYIDLKDDVSAELSATKYEIYFLSVLDDELTNGVIYIDNIKVVRYE